MIRILRKIFTPKKVNKAEESGTRRHTTLVSKVLREMNGNVLKEFEDIQMKRISEVIVDITLSRTPKYHGKMRKNDVLELHLLYEITKTRQSFPNA